MMKHLTFATLAMAALAATASAQSSFFTFDHYKEINFTSPDNVVASWDSYFVSTGPGNNAEEVYVNGADATATYSEDFDTFDTSGNVEPDVSSGNLYGESGPISITVASTFADFTVNNIVFQMTSDGSEYDPSSIFLNATIGGETVQMAPHFTEELFRETYDFDIFVPGQGILEFESTESVLAFQWDLVDLGDAVDFSLLDTPEFTITFDSLTANMSLTDNQLAFAGGNYPFEAFVVPEPATGTLVLAGLGTALLRRRKTNV